MSRPSPKPSDAPPQGTLIGTIDSGRILVSIEGAGKTRRAYVDPTGFHEVATDTDVAPAHAVWESGDSIVFDSERGGGRHLFRMTIGNGEVTQLTTTAGQERPSVSIDWRFVSDNYEPREHDRDLGLQLWSPTGHPSRPSPRPG